MGAVSWPLDPTRKVVGHREEKVGPPWLRLCSVWQQGGYWIMIWKGSLRVRRRLWPNLRCYPGICLGGLGKATKNLPGQPMSGPRFEPGPFRPDHDVRCHFPRGCVYYIYIYIYIYIYLINRHHCSVIITTCFGPYWTIFRWYTYVKTIKYYTYNAYITCLWVSKRTWLKLYIFFTICLKILKI
jgi:hypothetical protein